MAIGAEIPFGWSVRSRRAIDDRFITADLTTRDALSTFRRHKNLEVFVENTNRSYYLDNDTTNSDWMEVLKSIDVLTEDSGITDDDFLVWFDESEKKHKKIKKSNFKVLLSQLDQGGATTGQVIAWNGTTWAAGTVEGSKWTAVTNGIYRNGRVAIGTNTVGTAFNFDVVGNSRFSGSDVNVQWNNRTITNTGDTLSTGLNLNINRVGGVLNGQGPGIIFCYDEDIDTRFGLIGGLKRGTNVGDLTFYTRNTGQALRHGLTIRANKGVYIGDQAAWFNPVTEADSLQIKNRIATGSFTGTTSRYWKLGERKAATVLLDTTQYITVEVNGVAYGLAVITI